MSVIDDIPCFTKIKPAVKTAFEKRFSNAEDLISKGFSITGACKAARISKAKYYEKKPPVIS